MAQKVLEIKATDGIKNAPDNSFFQTVFSEPISLKAGSSIDMKTAFIDIGNQAVGVIEVATNMQLGVEFYRYEYDIAKVPTVYATDADAYDKRYIYSTYDNDYSSEIPASGVIPTPPSNYGWRLAKYTNSNLPSFLLTRTASVVTGTTRTETFIPEKQTATINIQAGLYTKQKLSEIINDQFNLITGSLSNADKPNELITPGAPPTRAPLDYKIPTNYTGQILKTYEYPYALADVKADDPTLTNPAYTNKIPIYTGDLTWNHWFFPVYTEPNPPTNYFNNLEYWLPYVWFYDNQQGFMSGAAKFNLEYDDLNDNYFISYTHTPILDIQGKEVVVFSKSFAYSQYDVRDPGTYPITKRTLGYKANGSMGGILISRLFSLELDANFQPVSQTNTGFWQEEMGFGFDDESSAQFEADFIQETRPFYFNILDNTRYTTATTNIFNITYPNPKYLTTNCTDSLIPIQWLVQTNYTTAAQDMGMAIFSDNMPKNFESIGTRPIYAQKQIFSDDISHYLIEINISHVRNDNFRDKDSYRQIMLIAGKTYSSGTNFLQTFDDGSIQCLNLDTDILIDKIEIRILNPDKTPAQGLGTGTMIYLNLTEPVIMEK